MINKFVVSLIMIFILFISSSTAYTIDNDLVYIDDANVYLSAYPHTINSSGWVYFNFTSKIYTGDVDFCLGYDSEIVKPKKHELYNPHWVNWTTNHQAYFHNVSSITQYNGDDFDFGNSYNTYQRQVIYDQCINHSEFECIEYEQITANCSFNSYTQEGTNYTIYWHTNHSRYELYSPFPYDPIHVPCNVQGMTDWYYIQNVPIVQNQNYQMRVWIELPISLTDISSKYFFAIKPSGETISQAITNGHFYYLDPWYNAQWGKRKLITVDHVNATGDTLLNFPAYINVSKETEMQSDYDDVVFVNYTTNTIMDYELENSTATHAIYWVNVTHLTSPNATFWMYYDNAGATSQEDPEGVWDSNTVMVHHFQDLNDSTSYNNDATNHGSTYNSTWLLDGERDFDGIDDYVDCGNDASLDITETITMMAWLYQAPYESAIRYVIAKGSVYRMYSTTSWSDKAWYYLKIDGGDRSVSGNIIPSNTWHQLVFTYRESDRTMRIFQNGVETASTTLNGLADYHIETNAENLLISHSASTFKGTIASVYIANRACTADYINQSYQMVISQSTFVTFGSDEDVYFTPPTPTSLAGVSWSEGVHWYWSAGAGNITNTYNVSYNTTWSNGSSNAYYNHTTGCGQTSNIVVWAYNTTGDGSLSVSSISDSKNALACPGVNAPVITDWYNNYTSDNSTSFTIPTTDNRTVFFNVTANQSITNWIWYVDGTVYQNTDVNNITYTWTLGGEKTVLVYGINGNGQTQTLTWSIFIEYTEYEISYLTLLELQEQTEAEKMMSLSIILSILIIIGIILFVLGFLVPNSILTFLGSMTFIISTLLPIPVFTDYPYFGIALTGILLMLGLISLIVTFYQWFTTYNAGKGYHRWDNDFDEL